MHVYLAVTMMFNRKMRDISLWLAAFLVALGGMLARPAPGACAELAATGVRIGVGPAATRFVIDLSDATHFQVFTLRDPYRVVIDLPALAWKVGAAAGQERGGVIDGYRFGLFKPGTFRIVLDVNHPVSVKTSMAGAGGSGHIKRLVLDLAAVTKAEFDRTYIGPPAPVPAQTAFVRPTPRAPPPGNNPRRDGKRVIVIDPGHGGVDPGATGVSGAHEKDLTLAAGRELKRQLEASGRYRVVMTRDTDVFLPLRERVQVARDAHAQLFVSLHADTIGSRGISGSSVYTLSDKASDAEAAALAAKENKADLIAGADLTDYPEEVADILIDLAQRETRNNSVMYAHVLVRELDKNGRLLSHSLRSAGFAVLKAPDVPSVLLEMGYLSNTKEERELRDPRYRTRLMAAVKRAIDAYFVERERLSKS